MSMCTQAQHHLNFSEGICFRVQDLMTAVEVEMTTRLSQPEEAAKFSRQHLKDSLWAFATLDLQPGPHLLTAATDAMQQRAGDCNPQELSNTVWACAKLGKLCYQEWLLLTACRQQFVEAMQRRLQPLGAQHPGIAKLH